MSGAIKVASHQSKLPLAVGFGISDPEQVSALEGVADGIIVGSAIVRRMAEAPNIAAAAASVGAFAEKKCEWRLVRQSLRSANNPANLIAYRFVTCN